MPHQYRRRTLDEAMALAKSAFRAHASAHLTADELQEMQDHGLSSGGIIGDDWETVLGYAPDERMHYEFEVYRPSEECPYVAKIFARILVTRDRASDAVHIVWHPPVPEYDGARYE